MRADLKSLKHRLEEELGELGKRNQPLYSLGLERYSVLLFLLIIPGMDEESAEQILSSFYFGQDALAENGEASPLKVRIS